MPGSADSWPTYGERAVPIQMSWLEDPGWDQLRNETLEGLSVDQALVFVTSTLSSKFYIYTLSDACYKVITYLLPVLFGLLFLIINKNSDQTHHVIDFTMHLTPTLYFCYTTYRWNYKRAEKIAV